MTSHKLDTLKGLTWERERLNYFTGDQSLSNTHWRAEMLFRRVWRPVASLLQTVHLPLCFWGPVLSRLRIWPICVFSVSPLWLVVCLFTYCATYLCWFAHGGCLHTSDVRQLENQAVVLCIQGRQLHSQTVFWRAWKSLFTSTVCMRGFTLAEMMFGWVLWVSEHPHRCQDLGFSTTTLYCCHGQFHFLHLPVI